MKEFLSADNIHPCQLYNLTRIRFPFSVFFPALDIDTIDKSMPSWSPPSCGHKSCHVVSGDVFKLLRSISAFHYRMKLLVSNSMDDNSQPALAIESFSYNWLPESESEHKPFSDSFIDFKIGKWNRESQNFNFDVPILPSSSGFSHADELFCNGLIRPASFHPSTFQSSDFVATVGVVHGGFLKRWRKSTRRVLRNLMGNLRLFCGKACCSREIVKVDDIERRVMRQVRSWNPSPLSSPVVEDTAAADVVSQRYSRHSPSSEQSTVRFADDWCDLECPIYEAVLHCKRSIEGRKSVGKSGDEFLELQGS